MIAGRSCGNLVLGIGFGSLSGGEFTLPGHVVKRVSDQNGLI